MGIRLRHCLGLVTINTDALERISALLSGVPVPVGLVEPGTEGLGGRHHKHCIHACIDILGRCIQRC